MAQRANLIATYNANPTLQKQYTLDQYLALFDFGLPAVTPPTTPTPTPEVPGVPNIINKNLNQGDGGDGDGPPPGPTFNRDDLLGTSDYPGTGPGFLEGLLSIPGQLAEAYIKNSPAINFVKGLFSNKKKEFKKNSAQMVRDEIARQEAAAAERAAFLAQAQRTNIPNQLGGPDGTSGGKYAGGDAFREANPYGGSGTDDNMGADSFAFQDGGRVYLYNRLK